MNKIHSGPFFSIVIPTYRRPRELDAALRSLESQLFRNFEAIVIDDSPDAPANLNPSEFSFSVQYLINSKNLGPSGARNRGVEQANGSWIVFLDDDDVFFDTKLDRLFHAISSPRYEGIKLFHHRAEIELVNERVSYVTAYMPVRDYARSLMMGNCLGGTPVVAIERAVFLELQGFDETLPALEDYELWLRLAQKGHAIGYLNEVLSRCSTKTGINSVSKDFEKNRLALSRIQEKHAKTLSGLTWAEHRRRTAWKHGFFAHILLMNRSRFSGIKYLQSFLMWPRASILMAGLLALTSPSILISARSHLRRAR